MSGPVSPPLTVKEADGTPTGRPINTIVVSNGDLSITGSTATIDTTGGGGGSASLTQSQIGFGSATDTLTGSANFTFVDESGSVGPTVTLTGDKPILIMQDDTSATDFFSEFTQSGASLELRSKSSAGASVEIFRTRSASITFNDDAADMDTIVKGDSAAALLYVDASQDNIGINCEPSSTVEALHVTGSGTGDLVLLESTDAAASAAPRLTMYRNSATPANNDFTGRLNFRGEKADGSELDYGVIINRITDATNGNGRLQFLAANGTATNVDNSQLIINGGSVIINEAGNDVDFRVESDTRGNAFKVAGDTGFVGINESAPEVPLEITDDGTNTTLLQLQSTDTDGNVGPTMNFWRNSASPANGDNLGQIQFLGEDASGNRQQFGNFYMDADVVTAGAESGSFRFNLFQDGSSKEAFRIRGSEVVVNDASNDIDFRVESNANAYAFQVDAGESGIGVNAIYSTAVKSSPPFQILNQPAPATYAYQAASGTSPESLTNNEMQGPLYQHISSSAHTFVLPEGIKGMHFRFFSSDGTITVDPGASDTVNGSSAGTPVDFSTNYQIYECVCYDTNKWVVSPPT